MTRFIAFLSTILILATAAIAEKRQFGNVIYELPKHWKMGDARDGLQYLLSDAPDDRCEYCYIYIATSQIGERDAEKFLLRKAKDFIDEDHRDDIETMIKPKITAVGRLKLGMYALRADKRIYLFLAGQLPDRIELLIFRGPARDEEDVTETMATFQEVVLPLFSSMKFVSLGASPLMPSPRPGKYEGVFWGWENYTTLGLDGYMQMRQNHRHLVFWPEGYVYDGEPPEGLAMPDVKALIAAGDTNLGVYQAGWRGLRLIFANGEVEEIKRKGDMLVADGMEMRQVTVLPDGSRISGSISSLTYSGFSPGSGMQGGVGASSETVFDKRGRYAGSRFTGGSGSFDAGGGFALSNEGKDAGTYEIRDGLLIQRPSGGGPELRHLIYKNNLDQIMIGDQFLED